MRASSHRPLVRLLLPCLLAGAGPAVAQGPAPAGAPQQRGAQQDGTDAQDPAALARRVSDLERELAEVKQELTSPEPYEPDFTSGPLLEWRGFADVTYGAKDFDDDAPGMDSTTNRFALGQLDFLPTARLSERITFLNETVLKSGSGNGFDASIERLIVKYLIADWLNVQVGRFHTTIGYWNEAFHHGEWLQTSIGRPLVVAFDGILPIHLVGVVLKGQHDWSQAGIDYTLEVGNGRGPTSNVTQNFSDANDSKAVNASLAVRPAAVSGLRVGGGVYADDIPPNANASAGPVHGSMDERILNCFATWHHEGWEVLAELFQVRHEDGAAATSHGWYVQAGRRVGGWTPYARVEGLKVADGDTFYSNLDDVDRALVGVRWDLSTWNALKLQIARAHVNAGPGGADGDYTELLVQTAFTF